MMEEGALPPPSVCVVTIDLTPLAERRNLRDLSPSRPFYAPRSPCAYDAMSALYL